MSNILIESNDSLNMNTNTTSNIINTSDSNNYNNTKAIYCGWQTNQTTANNPNTSLSTLQTDGKVKVTVSSQDQGEPVQRERDLVQADNDTHGARIPSVHQKDCAGGQPRGRRDAMLSKLG